MIYPALLVAILAIDADNALRRAYRSSLVGIDSIAVEVVVTSLGKSAAQDSLASRALTAEASISLRQANIAVRPLGARRDGWLGIYLTTAPAVNSREYFIHMDAEFSRDVYLLPARKKLSAVTWKAGAAVGRSAEPPNLSLKTKTLVNQFINDWQAANGR